MIGDKIIIREYHTVIAKKIVSVIKATIIHDVKNKKKYVISVAGESGSGKSEIGCEIMRALNDIGIIAEVFGQDDYFVFPPKTNHSMRLKNIDQVGTYEVKLDLIDANLFSFISGADTFYKPLIDYDKDIICHENLEAARLDVIIVEGTYTSLLEFVDCRVFIDRTYKETKADRENRGREKMDPFVENILEIEHRIINAHKSKADIVINHDFSGIIISGKKNE
ncbi:MAG: hypothetical protein KAU17_11445 [Spirochaetales bacterium]|jgi:uridine kinase|nr:hypothetical protein [Spirochaetales bacterium]